MIKYIFLIIALFLQGCQSTPQKSLSMFLDLKSALPESIVLARKHVFEIIRANNDLDFDKFPNDAETILIVSASFDAGWSYQGFISPVYGKVNIEKSYSHLISSVGATKIVITRNSIHYISNLQVKPSPYSELEEAEIPVDISIFFKSNSKAGALIKSDVVKNIDELMAIRPIDSIATSYDSSKFLFILISNKDGLNAVVLANDFYDEPTYHQLLNIQDIRNRILSFSDAVEPEKKSE